MRALILTFLLAVFITACEKPGFRHEIVYINSYHEGYPPSDAVMRAMLRGLPADTFKVTSFFMDTKRRSDSVSVALAVNNILDSIGKIDPDLIIASDDAAVKYVISGHQRQLAKPVVYCGVNWSSASYRLSEGDITGMVEVLPLREVLTFLKSQDYGYTKLAILSENSVSEKQNSLLLDTLYRGMGFMPEYVLVDDFDAWKSRFMELNKTADLIYLPTNGAVSGWNDLEAKNWVRENIRVPVFTCDDFMMPYAAIGFTKVAEEQGEYVAGAARQILQKKTSIRGLTEQRNRLYRVFVNIPLSEATRLTISDSLKSKATQIR